MSSVLIKGMKMPKNCNECDFCHWSNLHQTGICDRCGDEPVCPDYGTDYRRTRARFCPLIELPEKHGDLIDRKVLNDAVLKWLPSDPCGDEYKERPFETDICVSMMMEIEEQDAVIEAEGEG